MLVYDTNGLAHDKEPVDAKECIERLGWTIEPPEPVQPTSTEETKGAKK